ncbi:hypothetical protein Ddye_024773 [Dipteronia dyeriana]|uniref:Tyrosine decarboxylase n=1 Tax=Dipteronia dyeriana TaxID=168575 RepID=A0AAD9TVG5_9ROSI|nr:hypothetical protein Ddye_024773 [Dipteronia dyeriana]
MGSLQFEHEFENKPLDFEEFRRQGHLIIDFIANYYKNAEKYPIRSQVEPGYLRKRMPESAPYSPEPIETILQDDEEHIIPGITHWQSPNYFAYFPSSGSTASFLGEMLCSGFNVVGFNWVSSQAATELENIVTDWLGEMLNLPKSFLFSGNGGGVLQGTTCEAILCTLTGSLLQETKLLEKSEEKTLGSLLFMGSIKLIETIKSDIEDGLVPLFLCATIGTIGIEAVDPLQLLCEVSASSTLFKHENDDNEKQKKSNEETETLLEKINASGKACMSHAIVGGMYVIRFAVGASLTDEKHVVRAWKAVQQNLVAILSSNPM